MANELVTAKDLREFYTRVSGDGVVHISHAAMRLLFERIDRDETELAALRAKVARMEADVTHEEMRRWCGKHTSDFYSTSCADMDNLIAARAKEQP